MVDTGLENHLVAISKRLDVIIEQNSYIARMLSGDITENKSEGEEEDGSEQGPKIKERD